MNASPIDRPHRNIDESTLNGRDAGFPDGKVCPAILGVLDTQITSVLPFSKQTRKLSVSAT